MRRERFRDEVVAAGGEVRIRSEVVGIEYFCDVGDEIWSGADVFPEP